MSKNLSVPDTDNNRVKIVVYFLYFMTSWHIIMIPEGQPSIEQNFANLPKSER